MKQILSLAALLILLAGNIHAKDYKNWTEIALDMETVLNNAVELYETEGAEAAKATVNEAYFGYYEKLGVERSVLTYVSGKRASQAEYQFALIKKAMTDGAPLSKVREETSKLITHLKEDAASLDGDGSGASSWGMFLASLIIILREGAEAILIIAAIAAYLYRAGYTPQVKTVYLSAALAVLFSAITAYLLSQVFKIEGASREILEGGAMLLAVIVLYFTANWMLAKSESKAWKEYIEGKVKDAMTKGSLLALASAAFLSVFREGAETILFYQALFAGNAEHSSSLWGGFAAGCALLAAFFLVIRKGSMKLPLKPFFLATSVLMYIMCVAFAGGGVKEFQEADAVSVTPVPYVQSIDLLGIHPTVETLLPQFVLLLLAAATFVYYRKTQGVKS